MIDYDVSNYREYVKVLVKMAPYDFKPNGSQKEWIDYAVVVSIQHKKPVKLYEETQNKETGYVTQRLIWTNERI